MKGKLIVIEGACDGIGKSTQYNLIKKKLENDGYDVVSHHFPTYDSVQGACVEKYLSGEYGTPATLSPYFVNSLYAIDRAITWNKELKQEFFKGKIILLDRYTTSSLIYQSALIDDLEEKKKFIDYVCDFEYEKLGIHAPDSVIFLYAPFDLVTKIRNERKDNDGITNDIHERDLSFMKRVYESAMFVADYLGWDKIKCNDENNMRSIEDINDEIYTLIKKKYVI